MEQERTYSAFVGEALLAAGPIEKALASVKAEFDRNPNTLVLLFEDWTGRQVDFDLRGSLAEVLARVLPAPARTGPGRPKLGVTSREISLLPRHWEWLEQQPNGASAALRRLVDEARKLETDLPQSRQAREAVGRFLSAMAGDLPGYEEACRALYAVDRPGFEGRIQGWPADIEAWLLRRAGEAFWKAG
jgi:hypothetical protein